MLYNLNSPMIQSVGEKKDFSKLQLGSEQEESWLCTSAQREARWRLSRGTLAWSGVYPEYLFFFLFYHLSNPLLSWSCRVKMRQQHSHKSQHVHKNNPGMEKHPEPFRVCSSQAEPRILCLSHRGHWAQTPFKPHISGSF